MEINEKEFSEFDWQSYKKQIENTIKVNKMSVLNNELTLKWINENLKAFKKKDSKCQTETISKEEEKNIK